jgi:hypothetical protein
LAEYLFVITFLYGLSVLVAAGITLLISAGWLIWLAIDTIFNRFTTAEILKLASWVYGIVTGLPRFVAMLHDLWIWFS